MKPKTSEWSPWDLSQRSSSLSPNSRRRNLNFTICFFHYFLFFLQVQLQPPLPSPQGIISFDQSRNQSQRDRDCRFPILDAQRNRWIKGWWQFKRWRRQQWLWICWFLHPTFGTDCLGGSRRCRYFWKRLIRNPLSHRKLSYVRCSFVQSCLEWLLNSISLVTLFEARKLVIVTD